MCLGWKLFLPSAPASSLLSYLSKLSFWLSFFCSGPLRGITELFHMCKLCSPPTAHPITVCRCMIHALGAVLWSRPEILKRNSFAHLWSCSVLSISFTTLKESWTQQRQEGTLRISRLVWWGPNRGLSRVEVIILKRMNEPYPIQCFLIKQREPKFFLES